MFPEELSVLFFLLWGKRDTDLRNLRILQRSQIDVFGVFDDRFQWMDRVLKLAIRLLLMLLGPPSFIQGGRLRRILLSR